MGPPYARNGPSPGGSIRLTVLYRKLGVSTRLQLMQALLKGSEVTQ
jgi:hypothetical protein